MSLAADAIKALAGDRKVVVPLSLLLSAALAGAGYLYHQDREQAAAERAAILKQVEANARGIAVVSCYYTCDALVRDLSGCPAARPAHCKEAP